MQVTIDAYRNIKRLPVELQTYIRKEYNDVMKEFHNVLLQIEHTEKIIVKNNVYNNVTFSFLHLQITY